MADKFTDLLGRLGKGPKGIGTGFKLMALAGAAAYGIQQSLYTGKRLLCTQFTKKNTFI